MKETQIKSNQIKKHTQKKNVFGITGKIKLLLNHQGRRTMYVIKEKISFQEFKKNIMSRLKDLKTDQFCIQIVTGSKEIKNKNKIYDQLK